MISSDELIARLNPVQQEAVKNITGPSLVIAGAGSGKTRVLTHRIAYMLAKGIKSYNILSLTFTNKAANEMKVRIAEMVGEENSKSLWMGTFHSIFAKILRFEADKIGFSSNFTIYDSADSKSLIKKIVKEMHLEEDHYKPGDVSSRISNAKNNLVTPQGYLTNKSYMEYDRFKKMPEVAKIYQVYQNRCRQADSMDFDDILLYTNILLRDNPAIVDKYRDKFHYILVDEYQDTNFSQYLIVKRLSQGHQNLTVVGDDAQSIYSFRGAKIENILNFKNDYPQFKMYKLEQNYRSTQIIVDAANSIIKKNKSQIAKNTFSKNEEGNLIKVLKCSSETEEGFRIAMQIAALTKTGEDTFSDFAILYRTNAQSRVLEEALNKMRVPCKIHGGLSFFQRAEIKDIVAYFRLIINQKDEEALSRIINYPARGIGDTTIDKMTQIARNNNVPLWEVICRIEDCVQVISKGTCTKIASFRNLIFNLGQTLNTVDAYTFAIDVLEKSGIMKLMSEEKSVEGQTRYENVQELLNAMKEFTESDDEDEKGLVQYLERIALLTDVNSDTDSNNKVTLMTVHSAKGLEFKHCFLVGIEENLFPSQMSMSSEKDIEEERRLFYVALTRAEKTATLSYAETRRHWGKFTNCSPSRFINEIDSRYLDLSEMSSMFMAKQAFIEKSEQARFSSFKKEAPMANFKRVQPSSSSEPFESSNTGDLREGLTVEHSTFGVGKIDQVDADRVVINFGNYGTKTLLMKFAKLKIVNG
jgi:DNA helicase II / ATP-dependent DNA helicase PcrA